MSTWLRLKSLLAHTNPHRIDRRKAGPARFRPMVENLDDRIVPSTTSTIASNFNGTPIAAGNTVWFSSVFKASNLGANDVTILVTDQTITFTGAGTAYTVAVPDSIITLSSNTTTTTATTRFDAAQNAWVTDLPKSYSGNAFLGGAAFSVSTPLPGGINPVTWQGSFSTNTPGVSLKWQWGAAVYTSFGSPLVKPLDSKTAQFPNSDHAGTPENFKSFVIGGARGGGGSNWTGSYSSTQGVTPDILTPPPSPPTTGTGSLSGHVYLDYNENGINDAGDGVLENVLITLYDSGNNIVAQTTTDVNGFYSFTGLVAGTYTIRETQPVAELGAGFVYTQGTNHLGSLGGMLGNDSFTVVVGADQNGIDYDFGEGIETLG